MCLICSTGRVCQWRLLLSMRFKQKNETTKNHHHCYEIITDIPYTHGLNLIHQFNVHVHICLLCLLLCVVCFVSFLLRIRQIFSFCSKLATQLICDSIRFDSIPTTPNRSDCNGTNKQLYHDVSYNYIIRIRSFPSSWSSVVFGIRLSVDRSE